MGAVSIGGEEGRERGGMWLIRERREEEGLEEGRGGEIRRREERGGSMENSDQKI